MNPAHFAVYTATMLCIIAVAATGTSAWFLVPLVLSTGILAGYDLRKRIEKK